MKLNIRVLLIQQNLQDAKTFKDSLEFIKLCSILADSTVHKASEHVRRRVERTFA